MIKDSKLIFCHLRSNIFCAVLIFTNILSFQAFAQLPATPWPTNMNRSLVSSGIPSVADIGGTVYEPIEDKIYVVRRNEIFSMNPDGSGVQSWTNNLYYDLESVTTTGFLPQGRTVPYIYIGQEDPAAIVEFDPVTGTLTGKSWDVSQWIDSIDDNGGFGKRMEGITFVPDGHFYLGTPQVSAAPSGSGGIFLISMQYGHPATPLNAPVIVIDVDLANSGNVTYMDEWVPIPGRQDISDMHYSSLTRLLYIEFDRDNKLVVQKMDASGVITDYDLPNNSTDEEALAFVPNAACTVADAYIGEDSTGRVWQYDGFPFACVNPTNLTISAINLRVIGPTIYSDEFAFMEKIDPVKDEIENVSKIESVDEKYEKTETKEISEEEYKTLIEKLEVDAKESESLDLGGGQSSGGMSSARALPGHLYGGPMPRPRQIDISWVSRSGNDSIGFQIQMSKSPTFASNAYIINNYVSNNATTFQTIITLQGTIYCRIRALYPGNNYSDFSETVVTNP